MAVQSVKLNLIPGSVLPVVNVSQYDDKRTFVLNVYEGASTYDLTGKTVEIRGTKPDMHGFAYGTSDGVISVSGNVVTVSTTQQMTAVGGQTMAELRIKYSGAVLGTINFIIAVEPSALSDDTIVSDTDIPVIERYLEDIVDDCAAQALIAEGYAVGKQNGSAVSSGSPYYHNNASYYSGQAGNSATSASNSASSASGSATTATNQALTSEGYAVGKQNGSAVGSGSPYYHNNADYYNTQAAGSATAASGSATAAAADALEAEGWSVGTQNGTPVGSGSPYYHNNAKYYAGQGAPTALGSLSDVNLSAPTNDQVLKYDSVSGKWVNGAGGGSGVPSGGTTGQALTKHSNTDGDVQWSDVATPNDLKAKWDNAAQRVAGAYNLSNNDRGSAVIGNIGFTMNPDLTYSAYSAGVSASGETYSPNSDIIPIQPGTYKVTGCPPQVSGSSYAIQVRLFNGSTEIQREHDYGNGVVFTANSNTTGFRLVMQFDSGPVNALFKPMLTPDLTATYDDYVPYAPTNAECARKTDITSIIATGSTNGTGATIAAGTYFYLNGSLCKAKTAIANNATFTLNTNYEVATVGDDLAPIVPLVCDLGDVASCNFGGTLYKIGRIAFLTLRAPTTAMSTAEYDGGTLPITSFSYETNTYVWGNDRLFRIRVTTGGHLYVTYIEGTALPSGGKPYINCTVPLLAAYANA